MSNKEVNESKAPLEARSAAEIWAESAQKEINRLTQELAAWQQAEKQIRLHEEKIGCRLYSAPEERMASLLQHYEHVATQSLYHVDQFRNDLLIEIRALSLIAESVGDASTHTEKNARLRGLVGILETAYQKIHDYDLPISRHCWAWESVFRSNYPTRHYLEKAQQLEEQNKALKARLEQLEGAKAHD